MAIAYVVIVERYEREAVISTYKATERREMLNNLREWAQYFIDEASIRHVRGRAARSLSFSGRVTRILLISTRRIPIDPRVYQVMAEPF